ncbi:MAG: glutathione S-transferase family protein [Pseudomonadota bacterium]
MRLYYAPNTIAAAVAITLEEAGLNYETVHVDFAQGEQMKPGYGVINPTGRVPALETALPDPDDAVDDEDEVLVDPDTILTETGAILDYIADIAPHANLVPQNPVMAARMRRVMYYLASTMHVNHAHKARGYRWAANPDSWEDMRIKVSETMTASCAYVESECIAGPFVLGQTYSLADPYLFVVTSWAAGDGVDMEQFPRINAFQSAMNTRASVWAARDKGIIS